MSFMKPTTLLCLLPFFLPSTTAHIAAFGPGMYCRNGPNPSAPNQNSNTPVNPLYDLSAKDWWFQHDRGCDAVPPSSPSEFLEIPSGGTFTVELANNQAFTTLSYGGTKTTQWPDGGNHPEDWNGNGRDPNGDEGCIPADEGGYMHVQNETMAQGTAWAIAYESDLSKIKMEDLVVFSVLEHTPWHRLATYSAPTLPATCPPTGCTCAWLWIPLGCGQPNMYMQPYRCKVLPPPSTASTPSFPAINSTSLTGPHKKLAKAQPPVYCGDDERKCVTGAKQMIVFNQKEGDNTGYDNASQRKWGTPAYNGRNGFAAGAQEDIFEEDEAPTASPSAGGSGSGSGNGNGTVTEIVVGGGGGGNDGGATGAEGAEAGPGSETSEEGGDGDDGGDEEEEIGECVRKVKARRMRKRGAGAGKWRQ